MSALYRRKPEVVEALQVTLATTHDQIKALDPKANVGRRLAGGWLSLIVLANGQNVDAFGDWIVKGTTGRLRVFTATQFALDYDVIL